MKRRTPSVGLALGAGGARGLAHIPILKIFDDLKIKPKMMSGSSIGAVIGTFYASGMCARDIFEYAVEYLELKKNPRFWGQDGKNLIHLVKLLDFDFSGTGLVKGDGITHIFDKILTVKNFDELKIPFRVVAADCRRVPAQTIFYSGPILPAVKASMSIPGVFTPVSNQDQLLIDGACVNPVPWDILEGCDIKIAVSVMGNPVQHEKPPKAARLVTESFELMQRQIVKMKLEAEPPDLFLDIPLDDVSMFDFQKYQYICQQSEPAAEILRDFLTSKVIKRQKFALKKNQTAQRTA